MGCPIANERAGQLGLTARAIRDGSIGHCLLMNTGSNQTSAKSVTTRIAQRGRLSPFEKEGRGDYSG